MVYFARNYHVFLTDVLVNVVVQNVAESSAVLRFRYFPCHWCVESPPCGSCPSLEVIIAVR